MTITTTTNRVSYNGNGATVSFATTYIFYVNTDLVVILRTAAGVEITKVLTTDYTVTGGGGATGTVVMVTAPATGETLTILRVVPITQTTDFVNGNNSDAEVAERALDRATVVSQQLNEVVGRGVVLSVTSPLVNIALPDPGAGKFVRWNAAGTALEAVDIVGAGTIVIPVTIAQGGTNATSAPAALTQLGAAPLASPAFTGTPQLPGATIGVTQATGESTTLLATDAFVQQELAGNTNPKIPVRQTVLGGSVDSNGQANWLAITTGLQANYIATTKPVTLAFANGYDARGEVDTVTRLTADATNRFGSLPALRTSFLYADRTSASVIAGANTLGAPQYGEVYDRPRAALLHFNGTNLATLSGGNWTTGNEPGDDYGNTWTTNGDAKLDTSQKQFGTASVVLDGTGDFLECAPTNGFSFTRDGSWTVEGWFRWNVLPSVQNQTMFSLGQSATDFGILLELNDTAAVKKLRLSLSSNGTSADITSLTLGTSTTWVINTWYHIAITYDALAGKYFVYKDGVSEAALTITSALAVAQIIKARIGMRLDGTLQQLNGWADEARFSPFCRYPNGVTFTPSAAAFTPEGHFFSIPEMKMYEVTSACTAAGTDPVTTARTARVFVGEVDTNATDATAVRSYAYRGRYVSPDTTIPANGTRTAFAANLGFFPALPSTLMLRNYTTDTGYAPGMVVWPADTPNSAYGYTEPVTAENRITLSYSKASQSGFRAANRTTGTDAALTSASWKMFVTAQRGW